ncbi:MAG: IPT/TIG domain-containing protein [Anaerolineales bacterium]|nr:IPT/TIG domain-containing protein [Anaerolineales bacterium]
MKRQFKALFFIVILMVVTAAAFPILAMAAPSILSVSPNLIVNDIPNEITIHGTGFEAGTLVTVGSTAVSTTVDAADTLRAIVPPGFTPGAYTVLVTNPDLTTASLPAGLTVVAPASTPAPFARPQIVIDTYSLSVDSIRYGQDFSLDMSLDNAGGSTAYGIQVTFTSIDLLMLKNGGVVGAGTLGTAGKADFSQTMTAVAALFGVNRVSVEMNVSYYDDKGTAYSDKFPLNFPVAAIYSGGSASAATATPTGVHRPQLVVKDYETDADPMQPGVQFTLSMSVQNVGTVAAKGVTMIIGGGSASGSGSGTPQAGVSGGSGEFTNFAPVGSSNIQSLGDLQPGVTLTATQRLVVNVSTNPGAYPMKVTFSYLDDRGNPVNDEQVITLLVYNLPNVDVSFYQPIGTLMAGQPNLLPLQVVSLGKRTVVLGKMTVETSGGTVENGEGLVGSLDPGGYFTLDAMLTPNGPGPIDLTITIEYTDDFNQARTVTQTLTLDVTDMLLEPTPDLSKPGGGSEVSNAPESFWQKVWRFILGLLGLDSGAPTTAPAVEQPTVIPIVPGGAGGKG